MLDSICAAWVLPLVHSPRQAPKPLDAWFFKVAGVGMHLPSPGWLVASQRLNRWRKRGGLSFGAQGGPGLRLGAAGRLCAGEFTRRESCSEGTRVGTRWSDYRAIVGMGAHVCPCREAMTRQVSHVMSEYGSHVTDVRVWCPVKYSRLQLTITPQPLTRLGRFKNL